MLCALVMFFHGSVIGCLSIRVKATNAVSVVSVVLLKMNWLLFMASSKIVLDLFYVSKNRLPVTLK